MGGRASPPFQTVGRRAVRPSCVLIGDPPLVSGCGSVLDLECRIALVGIIVRIDGDGGGISNRGAEDDDAGCGGGGGGGSGRAAAAAVVGDVMCSMLMRLVEVAKADIGRASGDGGRATCTRAAGRGGGAEACGKERGGGGDGNAGRRGSAMHALRGLIKGIAEGAGCVLSKLKPENGETFPKGAVAGAGPARSKRGAASRREGTEPYVKTRFRPCGLGSERAGARGTAGMLLSAEPAETGCKGGSAVVRRGSPTDLAEPC